MMIFLLFSVVIVLGLMLMCIPNLVYGMSSEEKKIVYEYAESFFRQKNYHKSLEFYDKILNEDPQYANALGGKAAVFHRQGNHDLALEYYDKAIAINSTNPYFLSDKGNLLLSMGNDKGAEYNLKKSLELFPDFADALNGMANVYSYRHNYDKELLYRYSVLITHPDDQEALIGIANVYYGLKNYDLALKQYDAVLKINAKNVNALIGKGNTYVELREYEKAITHYTKALNIDPNNSNALKGSSIAYLKIGQYEKATRLDKKSKLNLEHNSVGANNSKNMKKIPSWVKHTFGWYYEDKISEDEVINSIKFLINSKIIKLEPN